MVLFLKWLGVADMPRVLVTPVTTATFIDHVVSHMSYPAQFSDSLTVDGPESLRYAHVQTNVIDKIEDILRQADPHAILAWVALDPRIEEWRLYGDRDAVMCILPQNKRTRRYLQGQSVPSYVNWLLEHTPWLPTTDGRSHAPYQCVMATLTDDLGPLMPQPLLPAHELWTRLRIDKTRERSALERIGVKHALNDLSWDEFYELLLELPRRDPEGKKARALYRALVVRPDDGKPAGAVRDRFLREGKLWGKRGDHGAYAFVQDLLYVDKDILPDLIRREVTLLDLDRRRGQQKVSRLFGVNPLDRRTFTLCISDHRLSPQADNFRRELERLKPYIAAMRMNANSDMRGLGVLKRLRFTLCESIQGIATINGVEKPITLNTHGDAVVDEDVVYVVADTDGMLRPLDDALISDVVGEKLAEFLQVERASDFARLALCSVQQRLALLSRVAGIDREEAKVLVEKACERLSFDDSIGTEPDHHMPPYVPVPPAQGALQPPTNNVTELLEPLEPQLATNVGKVTAQQQEHVPAGPPKIVTWRVQRTASGVGKSALGRPVTDAVRCQNVAWRFEVEQGRFPLAVDHFQGAKAPGCDVLSFESEDACTRFQQQSNWGLVQRFIEVKGRSSGHGSVELGGNELKAAKERGDRYYLYRVYEPMVGKFEIMVLGDPATARHDTVYNVDVFREPRTESWLVCEETASADVGLASGSPEC